MKVFRSVEKEGRRIYFWTGFKEVSADESRKKIDTNGCIWDTELRMKFLQEGEWLRNGYARAGVSAVVIGKNAASQTVTVMNRFNSAHPTRGGQLTLPSGLWDSNAELKDAALDELGKEVIVRSNGIIGYWRYLDRPLALYWVDQYAMCKKLELTVKSVEISDLEVRDKNIFDIYLDNIFQGQALLTCEPDTGSVEIMFLFTTETVLSNDMFADGEVYKGHYLDREVGVFTSEMLDRENLTSKAHMVRILLRSL